MFNISLIQRALYFDKKVDSLFYRGFNRLVVGIFLTYPSIIFAQFIDEKCTVTGYFGELWYAEEEDIIGKQWQFFKGWADDIFYSCDYAGQSAT